MPTPLCPTISTLKVLGFASEVNLAREAFGDVANISPTVLMNELRRSVCQPTIINNIIKLRQRLSPYKNLQYTIVDVPRAAPELLDPNEERRRRPLHLLDLQAFSAADSFVVYHRYKKKLYR